jgi:hypothetical protein
MDAERKTPDVGAVARWEIRAQTALGTGRRQLVHQWQAPRSPVLRVLLLPPFLVAALVVVVLALLLFAIVVAVGLAAVIASRVGLLRRRA